MKYLLPLILILGGCSSTPEVPALPGTLEGVHTQVNVDPRLFETCDPVQPIGDNVRASDVLDQHAKDVKVINCLRSKNKALVKTLREALNLKGE